MAGRPSPKIVCIGASAGGIGALEHLLSRLTPEFPAAVLVVIHLPATRTSLLPRILSRASKLPVEPSSYEGRIVPGHVYVAAPDHHLVVEDGHVGRTVTASENSHRPSIDVLFRSAAY